MYDEKEVKAMTHYKCELCGANLDAGEICDCRKEKQRTEENSRKQAYSIEEALAAMAAIKSILAR